MFLAYGQIGPNRYREIFGLDFEQFEAGQIFQHSPGVTVSQQDNHDESADTLNCAHIHYDEHYAAGTEFGAPLFVSTATLQLLLGQSWKTYSRRDRILSFDDIAMLHPVAGGDTLYTESEVLEVRSHNDEFGHVKVELRGKNQTGIVVCRVTCWMAVFRQGKHPYYASASTAIEAPNPKFFAYQQDETGVLVEQQGIYFDDFETGEIFEHAPRKAISSEEAKSHSLRSFNWDPRFIDREYSQEHFGDNDCPISEAYAIGAITASTTRTLGRVVANLGWKNFALTRHIYPNEKIRVETEIKDKRSSQSRPTQGILSVETRCFDDDQNQIASFDRMLLVYKKNATLSPGLSD